MGYVVQYNDPVVAHDIELAMRYQGKRFGQVRCTTLF